MKNISNGLGGHYILMNDIDLSGVDWTSIGGGEFNGRLNGNGHTIKNLTSALFDKTRNAIIENLNIENINIVKDSSSTSPVGTISNEAYYNNVTNCRLTGTVGGGISTGGFFGLADSTSIKYSSFTGKVYGNNNAYVGGLIGQGINNGSSIENSYVSGNIGKSQSSGNFGGIIGRTATVGVTKITNSTFSGSIGEEGFNGYAGGLIGYASYTVQIECSNVLGNIYADTAGGMIGQAHYSNSYIKNSYVKGEIQGTYAAGGLIGFATQRLEFLNSYVSAKLVSESRIGTMIGWTAGGSATYTNVIADSEKAGTNKIYGTQTVTSADGYTNLTTEEMNDSSNFSAFNTEIWDLSYGLPKLKTTPNYNAKNQYTYDVRFQIGANSDSAINAVTIDTALCTRELKLDYSTTETCLDAIGLIDETLSILSEKMSEIGATQNRLDSVSQFQAMHIENYTSALSTIMDADIAEESANYVKAQILQQTTSSLLSQAQSIQASVILNLIKSL